MLTARVLRLAAALAVAPLVVSAVYLTLRHGDYTRVGDLALTELITRDVGRYRVDLGPYSRDGWYHPGPALYYVLAIPYRLLGSRSSGMDIGALVINGASVVGMALIARRRGGTPLALITLVGCAFLMRSLGPDEMRLPWNPFVTVLPYGLLLFLVWALTCRDRWALPVAVFVASFVAQTHIGYVALALPPALFGASWLVASSVARHRADREAGDLRALVPPSLVACAVALVMWLLPLVEQVTGDPGNLGRALRWFREGGTGQEPARGMVTGWRLVSGQFGPDPEWLLGEHAEHFSKEPDYLYSPVVPVLLVVLATAVYVLWRRRLEGSGRLLAVWLVAAVSGIVATARTVGPVYEYRVGWARVLGMVAGVIAAWAGWSAVAAWRPALERRVLVPLALATLTVLAMVGSVAHAAAGQPQPGPSGRTDALVADVVDGLPPGGGPVVVQGVGSFEAFVQRPALALQLERRGVEVRLGEMGRAGGEHRADDGDERLRARVVIASAVSIPLLADRSGTTLLAYAGELSMDEVRERVAAEEIVPGEAALAVFLVEPPADPTEGVTEGVTEGAAEGVTEGVTEEPAAPAET